MVFFGFNFPRHIGEGGVQVQSVVHLGLHVHHALAVDLVQLLDLHGACSTHREGKNVR